MAASPNVKALRSAAKGLVFVSETEAGFEPFEWEAGDGSPRDAVLAHAGAAAAGAVEATTLAGFLRAVPKADRAPFDALAAALQGLLTDIQVFKIGEVEKAVYVVGRTASGSLAGLKTEVVET